MKLLVLFGPSAVGKMTVGQAIEQKTDLKLFHNHMSIEWVFPFFEFGTPSFNRLVGLIRTEFLREIAKSDMEGVIFTFAWALDLPEEWDYLDTLIQPFYEVGAQICYAELEADFDTRLGRNQHPHRIAHKPSKKDPFCNDQVFRHDEGRFRFNSLEGEFEGKKHLKVNNTKLSPEQAAEQFITYFKL